MDNIELVKQLAEEGMGWWLSVSNGKKRWIKRIDIIPYEYHAYDWNPLTDWNDCMGLVGEMVKNGYDFHAHWSPNNEDGLCQGIFEGLGEPTETVLYTHEEYETQDLKTPICMAAAKALGIDVE